jgi:hypothetical protein
MFSAEKGGNIFRLKPISDDVSRTYELQARIQTALRTHEQRLSESDKKNLEELEQRLKTMNAQRVMEALTGNRDPAARKRVIEEVESELMPIMQRIDAQIRAS